MNRWYTDNISTAAKTAVNGSEMFLLTADTAKTLATAVLHCSQFSGTESNYWWLSSPGTNNGAAKSVNGATGEVSDDGTHVSQVYGVRPALKLNLSSSHQKQIHFR